MDKQHFKHTTQVRVRNYEVDWQGIVHNATYLLYCEVGRIEYLKSLGASVTIDAINGPSKVVLVRNEIDYRSPARFDELLNVYTRIAAIRKTSFVMEGLLEEATSGRRIAENVAYHVWLDPSTDRPKIIDDEFRRLVKEFEGSSCAIEWPSYEV